MKLNIELVPPDLWGINLRHQFLSPNRWRQVKIKCFNETDYNCEICGSNGLVQGRSHRLECHEVWEYTEIIPSMGTCKLVQVQGLCPRCHHGKHLGLSLERSWRDETLNHCCRLNDTCPEDILIIYDEGISQLNQYRNFTHWLIDISHVQSYLKTPLPNVIYTWNCVNKVLTVGDQELQDIISGGLND